MGNVNSQGIEWQDEHQGWRPYDKDTCRRIIDAVTKQERFVHLTGGVYDAPTSGKGYLIDLEKRVQINKNTGKERPIRLMEERKESAPSQPQQKADDQGQATAGLIAPPWFSSRSASGLPVTPPYWTQSSTQARPSGSALSVTSHSSSSTASPVHTHHWEWQNDDGWTRYSSADSQALEAKYLQGHSATTLTVRGTSYRIDFRALQQTNMTTRRSRIIRRIPSGTSSSSPVASAWPATSSSSSSSKSFTSSSSTGSGAKGPAQSPSAAQATPSPSSSRSAAPSVPVASVADEANPFERYILAEKDFEVNVKDSPRSAPVSADSCFVIVSGAELQTLLDKESSDSSTASKEQDTDSSWQCPICYSGPERTMAKLKTCRHFFHADCIRPCLASGSRKCPICQVPCGIITGSQPNGTMTVNFSRAMSLAGFPPSTPTAMITYSIPSGTQSAQLGHPHPGQSFSGTSRRAYLPADAAGKMVLRMLVLAFMRRLIFTVGTSTTSGTPNAVVWNGIHHKTHTSGGTATHGYPDPTYLSRVESELASKGIVRKQLASFY